MVEHRSPKPTVVGSNPTLLAKKKKLEVIEVYTLSLISSRKVNWLHVGSIPTTSTKKNVYVLNELTVMLEVNGKYCKDVKIFTDNIEEEAMGQVLTIASCKAFEGQRIRIMPDVHAGKDICIGFVGTVGNYINPSHVGVDIGCSISITEFDSPLPSDKYAEFNHKVLKSFGFGYDLSPSKEYSDKDLFDFLTKECNKMKSAHPQLFYGLPDKVTEEWVSELCDRLKISEKTFYWSINSIGGGNHFVEYDEGVDTNGVPHYAVAIHCGSRNFGLKVCSYWYKIANSGIPKREMKEYAREFKERYKKTHDSMEEFGNDLKQFLDTKKVCNVNGYLSGENMHGYLCDMVIAMAYAKFNHMIIHKTIEKIMNVYGLRPVKKIMSRHNYIDFDCEVPVIRKGAIRSYRGEEMIVPFNMRDGIAICNGKSNDDWLCSCSHGSGRKMSRAKANESLSLDDFKKEMENVFSTTVGKGTLDEAPMAYKDTDEIKELIKDTCEIEYMLLPKINVKDSNR